MISPREVLIGSVVSYQGKPDIVKSVAQYVMLEGHKEWIGGSLIDGEKISKQWLQELGFEPHMAHNIYSNGKISIIYHQESFQITGNDTFYQFVHQLQLLHFSLTLTHLKIPKLNGKR